MRTLHWSKAVWLCRLSLRVSPLLPHLPLELGGIAPSSSRRGRRIGRVAVGARRGDGWRGDGWRVQKQQRLSLALWFNVLQLQLRPKLVPDARQEEEEMPREPVVISGRRCPFMAFFFLPFPLLFFNSRDSMR